MPGNNNGGNHSKRGLASADERTKKRVAKMGGEASGRSRRNNSNSNQ